MRALDLFCGAGGASVGLRRAGFEVVGVDINRQPNYPFEFIQADAMTASLEGFDLVWASPPCQRYSAFSRGLGTACRYPDLIPPLRERLYHAGVRYIIENVVGAPLASPIMLCGTMFDLKVRRHRKFEINWPCEAPAHPKHTGYGVPVYGRTTPLYYHNLGMHFTQEDRRQAMGIDWMNRNELAQAIPPEYAKYLGAQYIKYASR